MTDDGSFCVRYSASLHVVYVRVRVRVRVCAMVNNYVGVWCVASVIMTTFSYVNEGEFRN